MLIFMHIFFKHPFIDFSVGQRFIRFFYLTLSNQRMITNKFLITSLLALACGSNAIAQDDAFDLSSQRGERQDVNMVTGHKLDHHGIIVNPTPHGFNIDQTNWLYFGNGLNIIDKQKKFEADLAFLPKDKKGIKLTIDFGEKQARKAGLTKLTSGAYLLTVDKKGINIVGYDEPSTLCRLLNRFLARQQHKASSNCLTSRATITQTFPCAV